MIPDPEPQVESARPTLEGLPWRVRTHLLWRALRKSAAERRTQRALFFCTASLLVGFTVARLPGLFVCGCFGVSLYLVVLVLRMQRHLEQGAAEFRAGPSD